MPKIKSPKGSPTLDMTPMVDLAFLLVTFFMLTASSRVTEPVTVDPPSSQSDKILPQNMIIITVDTRGRVFFNINNPSVREATLERVGKQLGVTFTPKEIKEFGVMSTFGVPIKDLKKYIGTENAKRPNFPSAGIPVDSTNTCELIYWIQFGASEATRLYYAELAKAKESGSKVVIDPVRYAIKADNKTKYIFVKQVLDVFKKLEIFNFNMITNLEQESESGG